MLRWVLAGVMVLLTVLIVGAGLREPRLEAGSLDAKGGDTLVVLVHGFTLGPDDLRSVRETVRKQAGYGDADVLTPAMPFSLFSLARPGRVVADLVLAIDAAWKARSDAGRPYVRVVLVGHSMGGLYARKAYVVGTGENPEAPFEDDLRANLASSPAGSDGVRPWAAAVERLVLLAGMNRGWTISHHMSLTRAVTLWVGTAISRVLEAVHGRPPIVFSIRRGSPFITQLRLQWLAMRRHAKPPDERTAAAQPCRGEGDVKVKPAGGALTVQLLGTVDDLVAPDDNVDLVSGGDFNYLEVPYSGHLNVIAHDDPAHGAGRARKLAQALTLTDFSSVAVTPPGERITPDWDVTDVAFVIHGIRDEGFWTQKIARRIVAHGAARGRTVATETASYGYFPMLSFLWPEARRDKVEWLMDRYTEALARYPNACFSYVGHSHGTYLLARGLEDYPAIRFRNVVFAGSVVRTDFEWARYVEAKRVEHVVNFVATRDWVVAFFPRAMQMVGFQDLGGAGHDGFDAARRLDALEEARFVTGGHSAALEETLWAAIADFVVDGELVLPVDGPIVGAQSPPVALLATVAPLLWIVLGAAVVSILWLLLAAPMREWHKTVAVIVYLYLVWLVLTRL